ncbi:hypothetical protein ACLOJK_010095 [Asimina triloba]
MEAPEAANGHRYDAREEDDAGAAFVLESKGNWWHAGFHLTTAIVGPTILTLPYAFRGMGWSLGLLSLTVTITVTFYSYYLMSRVLDHCEKEGRRHIRFRELAADELPSLFTLSLARISFLLPTENLASLTTQTIRSDWFGPPVQEEYKILKPAWLVGDDPTPEIGNYLFFFLFPFYCTLETYRPSQAKPSQAIDDSGATLVVPRTLHGAHQPALTYGNMVLLRVKIRSAPCHASVRTWSKNVLQVRRRWVPFSTLRSSLSCPCGRAVGDFCMIGPFIAMVTAAMIGLSQLPSFHSLRHLSLASLLLSLGYTFLVVVACIRAGYSRNAPTKHYSLSPNKSTRMFDAFASISILASLLGNGILPEIQATVAPPATGKMLKGLLMCYSIIFLTFYSTAISGYWAFGNKASSNILKSLMPDEGPSLAPTWQMGLAVVFVLLQLFAIGLVYSQVAYEIMEKKSADVNQGMFSKRNLIPRLIFRTVYMVCCAFLAAMLPFFGDINGIVGAVGFIPLDFILPMLLYNMTYKPSRTSFTFWLNASIIVVFTGTGLLGAFASVRKLVLDANKFQLFSNDVVD